MVQHGRDWLAQHESPAAAEAAADSSVAGLLWSHSGLVRRPPDERWETRTDTLHRRARSVLPQLPTVGAAESLAALVWVHLGAVGPSTRADLAYFFGSGLRAVDAAVAHLGDEVVPLPGPDGETFLDLADPGPEGPGPDGSGA